ncbi:hypothetical protein N7526_011467 [Penicillium atrosanguineum]|nr:hypothetical protein N7526_011467 [Penicillium atrosanguineum]
MARPTLVIFSGQARIDDDDWWDGTMLEYAKPITADFHPLVEPHLVGGAVPPHKQSVGLETSQDPCNELEERYRRMELTTFCELFAQLRETTGERCGSARELVDPHFRSTYILLDAFDECTLNGGREGDGACLVSTCW